MKMNPVIFREYDIRGVYSHDFDDGFGLFAWTGIHDLLATEKS